MDVKDELRCAAAAAYAGLMAAQPTLAYSHGGLEALLGRLRDKQKRVRRDVATQVGAGAGVRR